MSDSRIPHQIDIRLAFEWIIYHINISGRKVEASFVATENFDGTIGPLFSDGGPDLLDDLFASTLIVDVWLRIGEKIFDFLSQSRT